MGVHCILGGTFTYVHQGHEHILAQCRKFRRISIGLTSDEYVRRHKIYPSLSFAKRLSGLKAALKKAGLLSRTKIHKIENEAGEADVLTGPDTIIVSEETRSAAERINAARKRRGLRQLKVVAVPLAYGADLKKISNIAIYEGKTDLSGRQKKPVAVQAGTSNPTKLRGASLALAKVFGRKFRLAGHEEHTGVPAHPFNQQTFFGAKNRAHAAWRRAKNNTGYSIGMESGLFELKKGIFIDITVCCVYDGEWETYGTGMGFAVPTEIARRIRRENSDLSLVLKEVAGISDIGKKDGAIGYFSDGLLKRHEQIEAAVACAFVPRIARARMGTVY